MPLPNFTFSDLVKHPVSVFLLTLMMSTSVMYFALTNQYEARIRSAESRERSKNADYDALLKQYIIELKEHSVDVTEKNNAKALLAKKDSITDTKIDEQLSSQKNGKNIK